jgi:hypothetical protein
VTDMVGNLIAYFKRINEAAGVVVPDHMAPSWDGWGRARRGLLPWQMDVLALIGDERDQMNEVLPAGPWCFAKFVIPDSVGSEQTTTPVHALITRLFANGEQFTVDVFRPRPATARSLAALKGVPAPRPYRFVFVTWGDFAGLSREETADNMIGAFGDGAWDPYESPAAADGTTAAKVAPPEPA